MFVKVYEYHIQEEKIEEYLRIQKKAGEIYRNYIDAETTYLHSKVDSTKWLEMTYYKSEDDYRTSMELINKEKEIQELFTSFEALLVTEKSEIKEEDFFEIIEK
ncbi:hypothetical protein [Guptibacillus hwajinpoensis]|uniref:ABM domain-containing protein n=1 Tax=Guptibacillus hwajinpoensis TaxID=208199 RepID=A0ABU0K5F2_9BACL|nr:hypothetical protein [Alkalihalobacillus hemicentroti]MDQ0483910.1 hypothetical protein [Alkalihalobacillus hemicentroti]